MLAIAIINYISYVNKTKNIKKSPMKICKHCDFRHISGIFGWKKVFLKNWTWPCFGHCYYAFLNKKSVKTNCRTKQKRLKWHLMKIFICDFLKMEKCQLSLSFLFWCDVMMKSRENAKKPVFRSYFWLFWPEKYVFRKSGSVTFKTVPFFMSVPNFMKKYEVQLEKFKKYRFSGENRLYRRFLESSGYKNQFIW